jgi:hypothetical protein
MLIETFLRRRLPPRLQWYYLLVAPLLKIPLTLELIVSFGVFNKATCEILLASSS